MASIFDFTRNQSNRTSARNFEIFIYIVLHRESLFIGMAMYEIVVLLAASAIRYPAQTRSQPWPWKLSLCISYREHNRLKKLQFQGTFVDDTWLWSVTFVRFQWISETSHHQLYQCVSPSRTVHAMVDPPWELYSIHHTTRFRNIRSSNRYPE